MTKAERQLEDGRIRFTTRLVDSEHHGPLVCELRNRTLILRPVRTKRGGPAEVVHSLGALYLRGMAAKVEERMKARRRSRKGARR